MFGKPSTRGRPRDRLTTESLGGRTLRGIALMLVAVGLFALMDTTAKYLAKFYPMPGIVWARFAGNLALLVVILAGRGELRYIRTARPGVQMLRGLLLGCATMLFFLSLTVMPIAEAAAIAFVMPLFIALLAVPMLNEPIKTPRILAVLTGLVGALIIVRPGSALFTPYALLPLGTAAVNAIYHILTRKIASVEPPLTSLFYGAFVGTVMFAPVIPFAFQAPQGALHWALLAILGALATVSHLALIRAYACAPASVLSPFHYSILLWGMLFGLLVFGDFPDHWSLVGMTVIVLSGLYLADRQRRGVDGT
jgi:drug/metabolite transporter (DMT)-like permease